MPLGLKTLWNTAAGWMPSGLGSVQSKINAIANPSAMPIPQEPAVTGTSKDILSDTFVAGGAPPPIVMPPPSLLRPKEDDDAPVPIFTQKRNYEVWLSIEHLFNYGIGNLMAAAAHYYYRVADFNMRDSFLFDQENFIGRSIGRLMLTPAEQSGLNDPTTTIAITEDANVINNWASGIKIFFQFPNIAMHTLLALRSRANVPQALASVSRVFRSTGGLAERGLIVGAGLLYNNSHAVIVLPGGLELNSINMLSASHLAVMAGSAASVALGIPMLVREGRKKEGAGAVFLEMLNSAGSGVGNVILSAYTLYFLGRHAGAQSFSAFVALMNGAQPAAPLAIDASYKILQQSFAIDNTVFIGNMLIMMGAAGLGLWAQAKRYSTATKEHDVPRQKISRQLIAASCASLLAAIFLANPPTIPLGMLFSAASSIFLVRSFLIKHETYYRERWGAWRLRLGL